MNDEAGSRGRVASAADDADRAVLVLVAAGQLDALQDLYDKYRTMAYSIALRITADASLAEDVVQDAFLGAWRNAARYVEAKGSVKTWLLSIVHHRAVDAVRRRRPTVELPEREAVPPSAMTLPDIWPEVAGNLDRAEIAAALTSLSDVQREALELAYFGGLTLTAAEGSRGSGIAAVAPDGSLVMAMRDLPATAGTQVYEAWVIVGEAAPVPVGSFTVGPNGTAAVTTQPVATQLDWTIALSLEPAPGSTAPLGPIVATGVSTAPKS